jgi:uncharacterized protein Yka (UPF0111/DUF47 family)
MTDEELRQLVESNARTAQAMLNSMAEARMEREELREQFHAGMQRMEASIHNMDDVVQRLTMVQEGMMNLLASLDDDRPTILRRLSSIENKVDRLQGTE